MNTGTFDRGRRETNTNQRSRSSSDISSSVANRRSNRALQLNSLSYRLQLIVGASATARETFEGTIEFVSELTSEYSPAMALEGWKVFRIDEVQTFHLGNEGVEYWATELPSVDTLGDLRANSK